MRQTESSINKRSVISLISLTTLKITLVGAIGASVLWSCTQSKQTVEKDDTVVQSVPLGEPNMQEAHKFSGDQVEVLLKDSILERWTEERIEADGFSNIPGDLPLSVQLEKITTLREQKDRAGYQLYLFASQQAAASTMAAAKLTAQQKVRYHLAMQAIDSFESRANRMLKDEQNKKDVNSAIATMRKHYDNVLGEVKQIALISNTDSVSGTITVRALACTEANTSDNLIKMELKLLLSKK